MAIRAIDPHLVVPRGLPFRDVLILVAGRAHLGRRIALEGADELGITLFDVLGAVAVAGFAAHRGPQVRACRIARRGLLMAPKAGVVLDRPRGGRCQQQGDDRDPAPVQGLALLQATSAAM